MSVPLYRISSDTEINCEYGTKELADLLPFGRKTVLKCKRELEDLNLIQIDKTEKPIEGYFKTRFTSTPKLIKLIKEWF